MTGEPVIKPDTFVVTFFHLIISHSEHGHPIRAQSDGYARVMLNDQTVAVLGSCRSVVRASDPSSRDDQVSMGDTRRADLETPPLKLVLCIDLAIVSPSRRFRVARRDGLHQSARFH